MSDWKSDLDDLFTKKEKEVKSTEENVSKAEAEIKSFFSGIVVPAFEDVKPELEKHQREVNISSGSGSAGIEVIYKGNLELRYSINTKIRPDGSVFLYPEIHFRDRDDDKMCVADGYLRSEDYFMAQITKDKIINHFLKEYKLQIS